MNFSRELNEMYNSGRCDDPDFWQLLQQYVGRVVNRMTDNRLIDDLIQDCCIEIWKSLPRFKADPAHNGSGFSRWVTGVCKRRAFEARKSLNVDLRFIAESQLSARDKHGNEVAGGTADDPIDLLAKQPDHESYFDLLAREELLVSSTSIVGYLRENIPARQNEALDLLIAGWTKQKIAKHLGVSVNSIYLWVNSWRELLNTYKERPSHNVETV